MGFWWHALTTADGVETSGPGANEDFFDMLVSKQASRFESQRSAIAGPKGGASAAAVLAGPEGNEGAAPAPPPALDDDMDFFAMLKAAKK